MYELLGVMQTWPETRKNADFVLVHSLFTRGVQLASIRDWRLLQQHSPLSRNSLGCQALFDRSDGLITLGSR